MKYYVLYRLSREGYAPGMSTQEINVRNHRELNETLIHIRQKWELRGYQVQILTVDKRPLRAEKIRNRSIDF